MKLSRLIIPFILAFFLAVPGSSAPYYDGLKIIVNPEWITQGKSFSVKIYSLKPLEQVSAKVLGKMVTFFRENDHFSGVVGVPLNTVPGKYKMHLYMKQSDGALREHDKFFYVHKGKFERVSYWLKPGKTKLLAPEIIDRGWEKIHRELARETPERLWKGPFRIPTIGVISMSFGSWQVINGEARDQHRGTDFAGYSNYRVRAANAGQVVLAEELEAFGNTIVINHGQGIHSMYFHLSRLDVVKNEIVWKGKILGLMGQTGVATGVHLHWGVSVHDVRVDPMQWVREGL